MEPHVNPPRKPRFNKRAAEGAKREAMARVEAAANEAWKHAAIYAVLTAARTMRYLTSDDVMKLIPDTVATHELRALGPIMLYAARNEWIEKADVPGLNSTRPSLHASPRTVWKSLIYRGPAPLRITRHDPSLRAP